MAETLISPGVLAQENDNSFLAPAPLEAGAAIIGPTVKGPVEQPTVVTSYGQYQNIFGTTFTSGSTKQEYLTSLSVKSYFNNGGNSMLVTRVATGTFSAATGSALTATDGGDAPFTFQTLGTGTVFNNGQPTELNSDGSLISGTSDNIRYEITNVDTAQGTFSLLIRRGDDNHKNKAVLESFNDLSLDPNNSGYIEKVIGNQTTSVATDGTTKYVQTSGSYVNRSKFITITDVARQTLDYIGTDGNIRVGTASGSLPVVGSGSFGDASGDLVAGGDTYFDNISTVSQGITVSEYADAIAILSNQDEYLFNIISAPGLIYSQTGHSTQIDAIISLAESRGDCIAVVDAVSYGTETSNAAAGVASINSSYAANYWPWLQMQSGTGKNVWVPASTVIPGIYAFTDGASAPWFAPAGLTRGGISDVIQAERKLTRTQRDTLYAKNVNPIATFPGSGISVFGQKTLQKKKSALDRVNVRRLLIELKKFLGDTAKTLVFEQNTIATRSKFLATVNPYLNSVVQRQGLYAFRVVMDESNNTADVIDRNQLIGQVLIQPAKTVEFVVLDFTIEPTGATFGA